MTNAYNQLFSAMPKADWTGRRWNKNQSPGLLVMHFYFR